MRCLSLNNNCIVFLSGLRPLNGGQVIKALLEESGYTLNCQNTDMSNPNDVTKVRRMRRRYVSLHFSFGKTTNEKDRRKNETGREGVKRVLKGHTHKIEKYN